MNRDLCRWTFHIYTPESRLTYTVPPNNRQSISLRVDRWAKKNLKTGASAQWEFEIREQFSVCGEVDVLRNQYGRLSGVDDFLSRCIYLEKDRERIGERYTHVRRLYT